MARAWLSESPLDGDALTATLRSPENGAVLLFLGTVRRQNAGRTVAGMRYEAYPAMAGEVLTAIVSEAEDRWPGSAVAAVHRLGDLAVGDASVAIAVAAPHRAEAWEASRYVIEEIKKRLPVWKKERYADGTEAWLDGAIPSLPGERDG